jgi:hypothetical protein
MDMQGWLALAVKRNVADQSGDLRLLRHRNRLVFPGLPVEEEQCCLAERSDRGYLGCRQLLRATLPRQDMISSPISSTTT